MTDTPFADNYSTKPPVPVEGRQQIAHCADEGTIPSNFAADEHVATIDGWTVLRGGVDCPRCESNVFYHPESLEPPNTVMCFKCSFASYSHVWWEPTKLTDFTEDS
jgi:hypothetical protein